MAMRWLTREWQSGSLPEAERTARWSAYLDHRDSIAIHLPPGLHRLASASTDHAITLHAAVPDWWAVDGEQVTLAVVAGNPIVGYQRVILQYRGAAKLTGLDEAGLDAALAAHGAELLYDEIEIHPGRRYEHRFLLAPDGEFEITFADVTVVSAPASVAVRDALLERRAAESGASGEPAKEPTLTDMPIGAPTPAAPQPAPATEASPPPAASASAAQPVTVVTTSPQHGRSGLSGWFASVRRRIGLGS